MIRFILNIFGKNSCLLLHHLSRHMTLACPPVLSLTSKLRWWPPDLPLQRHSFPFFIICEVNVRDHMNILASVDNHSPCLNWGCKMVSLLILLFYWLAFFIKESSGGLSWHLYTPVATSCLWPRIENVCCFASFFCWGQQQSTLLLKALLGIWRV